jgi:hypothetical protein
VLPRVPSIIYNWICLLASTYISSLIISSLVILQAVVLTNFALCPLYSIYVFHMILALSTNYFSTQLHAVGLLRRRRTLLSVKWHWILRRLGIVAKSVYCLRHHVCLSVCRAIFPSPCISATVTGQIYVKFDTGKYMQICLGNPKLVKIGQNIGHFTWRPKYFLLLPATLNRHKIAVSEWNGFRLLR